MRKCGLLMPVSALPSKYGIGSFGKWAYAFVDFLKKSGHTYWQMLPLVQTGYADSPYATCADGSGNPYFIDLEVLRTKRLLTYREVEAAIDKEDYIDYGKLYSQSPEPHPGAEVEISPKRKSLWFRLHHDLLRHPA